MMIQRHFDRIGSFDTSTLGCFDASTSSAQAVSAQAVSAQASLLLPSTSSGSGSVQAGNEARGAEKSAPTSFVESCLCLYIIVL